MTTLSVIGLSIKSCCILGGLHVSCRTVRFQIGLLVFSFDGGHNAFFANFTLLFNDL